jgi:hypothetical protein
MTQPARISDNQVSVPCDNVIPLRPRQSSVNASAQKSLADDPYAFGAAFPDMWRAFLHAHYRNQIEVAYCYGVTEKAAEKWWQGIGGPNGAKVAIAFQTNPEGAARFLNRAA